MEKHQAPRPDPFGLSSRLQRAMAHFARPALNCPIVESDLPADRRCTRAHRRVRSGDPRHRQAKDAAQTEAGS